MHLEQQVNNKEIGKLLKELGVKQESLFYHKRLSDGPTGKQDWYLSDGINTHALECYSAFTVAELGEMLPLYTGSEKHSNEWRAGYFNSYKPFFGADTEADARGKMLIYLLENKLITL